MIHDLLKNYKNHLLENYSKETATTYHKRISKLLKGQHLTNTVAFFNVEKIIDNLKTIEHKTSFSLSKNSFLHFCKWQNISLSAETIQRIAELEKRTRKKYRKLATVEYGAVESAIKNIRNAKLKLSYGVMLATGLRVSEVSQIRPSDCMITCDCVTFRFIGKGGECETVALLKSENAKLFERITEQIENTAEGKKLFYSAVYLQRNAKDLGFACHDLRRAYAKLEYKKSRSKEKVKEKLRHSKTTTTDIYLKSKVKL